MQLATRFEGRPLVVTAATLIAVAGGVTIATGDASDESLRAAIRLTARTSFVCFVLAYSASGAHALLASRFTAWQLRNRRYLGLAFAASHALHALVIVALASLYPVAFAAHTRTTNVASGLVGYGFILAMAATSNNRAIALIGPRAWKVLHWVGGLYVWTAFFKANWVRVGNAPGYGLALAVLIGAMLLRIANWAAASMRNRNQRAQ